MNVYLVKEVEMYEDSYTWGIYSSIEPAKKHVDHLVKEALNEIRTYDESAEVDGPTNENSNALYHHRIISKFFFIIEYKVEDSYGRK